MPKITLEVELPEPYRIVSIYFRGFNNFWAVCVCEGPAVAGEIGQHYGMGEHPDLQSALLLALERSEAKKNQPALAAQWKPEPKAPNISGLNIGELDL